MHRGKEGGVCGVIRGAEEHGNKLEVGSIGEVWGGLGAIVVVPSEVGARGVPDVVVLRVVGIRDVDKASFWRSCDLREAVREDGKTGKYYGEVHGGNVVGRPSR